MQLSKSNDVRALKLSQLLIELGGKISNSLGASGERATGIPGLMLYRCTAPTAPNPCTYEPSLLVIAQGRKRVDLGKTSYVFGQSRFLLTSVELPIVSRVVTASEEAPYLAFFLRLDIPVVRDILNTEEVHVPQGSIGTRGMAIGEATVELVRSCSRMMDILDAPQDIPFLSKLIQREIIYRLLQGTQGASLRAIATLGDQSHRTEKAVAWLRANYEKPLRVGQLAMIAGMGAASPFSGPYRDESSSIPEAASPSCRATADAHEWIGCGECSFRGRLRKREPVQSRIQAVFRKASDAGYTVTPARQ
jgi:hypothetical protein